MDDTSLEANLTTAVTPVTHGYRSFSSSQPRPRSSVASGNRSEHNTNGRPIFGSQAPRSESIHHTPTERPVIAPTASQTTNAASVPRFAPSFKPRFSSVRPAVTSTSSAAKLQTEPKKVPVFKTQHNPKLERASTKNTRVLQNGKSDSSDTSEFVLQPREATIAPSVPVLGNLPYSRSYGISCPMQQQGQASSIKQPSTTSGHLIQKPAFNARKDQFANSHSVPQNNFNSTTNIPAAPEHSKQPAPRFQSGIDSTEELTPSWTPLGSQNSAAPWGLARMPTSQTPGSRGYQQVPATPQWPPSVPRTPSLGASPGYSQGGYSVSPAGSVANTPGKRKQSLVSNSLLKIICNYGKCMDL